MNTMNATVKKIWNIFTTTLVVIVMILVLLLVGVRLFGLRVFTVLSGSMEPTYQTGSLIYVKKVDPFTLETGDVITFMMDADTIATHRVAGIVPDEDEPDVIRFRTKGDANDMEDTKLVHCANVVGVPVFTIPKLGYAVSYVQEPPGSYIAISVAALLLMLVFLPDLFESEDSGEKKPGKEKARRRQKDAPNSEPEGEEIALPEPEPAAAKASRVRKEKAPRPVREPKPAKEKAPRPVREPKPAKEKAPKPVREPKPVKEKAPKPVREPKPVKEKAPKPVREARPVKEIIPESRPAPAQEPVEEIYDLESILAEFRMKE